jgi:filamentous hemagglutinin
MKTIKEMMVRPRDATAMVVLRSLVLAIALATVGIPVVSWAQQVPDAAAGAHRPKMDSAANGVPVVDIVAPNAQGVSHNKYQRFDVDQRGVILNNSAAIVRTQLGGYIAGNDNLKGGEASLILNEVTSALPSSLRGYIEVGGKAAPVVIANPYGITCDGCGVINSQRFTLTTGTPVFGGSGSLDAFHVTGGSITIGSGGLDGSVVDRTDLIARAVQVNGQLWAKDLNVVTGSNDANYADGGVRANAADAAHPAVAIDVAALGGMYAEKIRLVGTEAGVGVVSSGAIAAQAGDLELTSAGEVRLGGTTVASNNVSVSTPGTLSNTGQLYAGQSFDLRTGMLHNDGTIYGLGGSGNVSTFGLLETTAASTLHAGKGLTLNAAALNSSGIVDAGGALAISSRGDVNLAGAVQGGSDVAVRAANQLNNTATVLSGGRLDLQAARIANQAGAVAFAGSDLAVTTAGGVVNDGSLVANRGLSVTASGIVSHGELGTQQGDASLTSTADMVLAGNTVVAGTLNLRAQGALRQQGQLTVNGLNANAQSLDNSGELYARGDAQLHTLGDLSNTGSLHTDGGLTLSADGTVVNSGSVHAEKALTLNASGINQAQNGQINAAGALKLTSSGLLDNQGSIVGNQGLDVRAGSLRSNGQLGTTAGDVSLTTTTGDLTLAGTTVSAGSLVAQSAGALAQTGSMNAAAATLASTGDLSLTGDTSVTGVLALDAGHDLHNTGSVRAGSTLDLHTTGDLDNRGSIATELGGDVRVDGALVQTGDGKLQSNGDLSIEAGRIDNAGTLASTKNLALKAQGDLALSGSTQAGGALTIDTAGDVRNSGSLLASSALSITANRIGNTGSIATDGAFGLHARTALNNQGSLYTGKAFNIAADTFTLGAAASLSSAEDITIDVTGALDNAGKIVARNLDLRGGSVTSTGALGTQQGDLHLEARQGDLTLGGIVSSAGAVEATASGAIRQSGQLAATDLDLNAVGDVETQGDITAHTATLTSGATLSQAGTLAADSIALKGSAVKNDGRTLSSGYLTVHGGSVDVAGVLAAGVKADGTLDTTGDLHVLADTALTAHGSLLAGRALDVQANAIDLSAGTQRAGGDASLIARAGNIDHTAGDLAAGGTLTAQASGALINRGTDGHDARMQANALLLQAGSIDNDRGKLLQTGASALTIRTAGTLDNSGGTLATNGNDLTLHGGRVINTSGTVQLAGTGQLDVSADQDIDNRQGTLAGNGATRVTAGTALINDGGLINAHGATVVAATSLSNLSNGAISGSTLGVTVTGGVNNTGGLMQATGGDLSLTAASLSNGGGTIQSAPGAVTLGIGGTLDNGTGTIAAGWLAKLTTVRLINAGNISAGQLNVQATDTLANTGGLLQSRGAIDLRATNGFNNNAGSIEANGTTTLNSASISNVGGRIANASAAITQVTSTGGIDNRGGTLGGQGDVSLSGTSISNAQGGTLVAAGNMTLGAGQLDNTSGNVYAGNTFSFVNAGASAFNANGKITAGRQLNLTLASLDNSGGTVQAGIDGVGGVGNVMLDIRSLVGQGSIVANNTLGMHLAGDYLQAAGSSIKANGGFNLAVDGQFVNNGSIQAVNGLTISAANITNNAGALLDSANTQLNTGGTITNAGSIQGNTVGLHAGVVNNTGSIMGGDVTIQAGTVINGADLGRATDNATYQSGTIAATNSIDIYTNYLLNRDAQIFSLGNINVAGAARNGQGLFDTRAGQIDNLSGSIQAQGSILLAANQINNVRRVLDSTSHTLTQAEYDASQPLPRSDYKYGLNKVQEYETYTEYHTIDETVVSAASAQSQIVAGGNISLYGSVNNTTSTIAAGGFLAVNQSGAGGGTGMVFGNETVANNSLAAGRTIQKVAVTHHIGCGTDQSLCNNNPENDKESYTRTPDTNPADYIHDNYTALGAVMSGAQGVSIGGVNVSNGGVTPDGRQVGNTRLDPNAQAIGLSSLNKGNAQGATGVPIGAQVDPATGHAPQVLGGAGEPLAGVTLPTGGIYSVRGETANVDASALSTVAGARAVGLRGNAYLAALLGHAPSGNYLIETNSRFVDYSQFISSEYLLDQLGLDPARTMMRLGDGFYEQQLVVNQVTQLTGRAYLSDYSSGLQEYQSLMNNATHVAQAMNLSIGVALTADQVSALTQDMVWMVQQNVDGHEVLVPVVYLASGNLGLTAQGSVIAGKDVSIDASGSLSNGGLIQGQSSTLLTAQDLLNSGRISSDGLTAISATNNITNVNGRIDGAGVSLIAGGDIRSENVGGLVGRGMDASSITATQGMQISAGNNLSLDHTTVKAGGDALLSAGHDLTLAGQGVSAGGSLALAAGNNLSLESSLTTTHPYQWSSSITGTQAEGITLSAGKDLSLVAGNNLNLFATTLKAGGNAALQAGNDLTLGAIQSGTHWSTQTQGSSVDAGGSLMLQAGHDLGVQAGSLSAGGDMALLAGHDLSLTATTNGTSTKVTHDVTSLDAGGSLAVAAGHDVTLEGTQLKAGGTAALQAGNDLTMTAVTDSQTTTASWKEGKKHITQTTTDETVRGVTVDAGTGVQIAAGHDATLDAATIGTRTGDITLAAGHDLTLNAEDETHSVVTDTKKKKSGLLSSKTTTTHDDVSQTYAVGTSLSGDNVHLIAGNDLTATAAKVEANGSIALSAGHDVNLLAGEDVYDESHSSATKRSGMTRGLMPTDWNYQTQARKNVDTSEDRVAVGTTISGDSVTITANHDVTTQAAQIAGTHDVTLAAGHDLIIGTGLSTHAEGHEQSVSTSGFIQNGLSVTIGNQKQKSTLDVTQIDSTGSLIGSTDGRVTLAAGQDVHITGSDVLSHTGTSIIGQNVTIDAGLGTVDTRQTQSVHSGGINVGLTGGMVSAAQGAYASAHRAGQVDDDRLKALYAVQAGVDAYNAASGIKSAAAAGDSAGDDGAEGTAKATGISIRVGLGASTANSHSTTHDDTTAGSSIRSDGDVAIVATNGNLNVIGSQISGKDVALAATGDLNLLSQLEAHTQKSSSANASGEVGFSVGSQTGIYVTANVGKGIAHGNGTTNANTSVNASGTLSIVSGNDTNILGAQAKGETVVAAIGGDLNIASQQATNDYASQYWQVGGTYVYGYGSQVNIAVGKTTSNYKSVDEVSGIGAGDGGYNIYVGGNTDLKGGAIASSADAAKNALNTGSLTYSDIENKADYHSVSVGISAGSGGFSGSIGLPQSKDSNSTTRAGIAEGSIAVRNQPGVDLSGLDRNPDIDAGGLKPIFDEKKVAEKQELFQAAGQLGYSVTKTVVKDQRDEAHSRLEQASAAYQSASTDDEKAAAMAMRDSALADMNHWSDGGSYKIATDVMVGTVSAYLGGGSVAGAAAGALSNDKFLTALSAGFNRNGVDADVAEKSGLMSLAAIGLGYGVGSLVGGGTTGAATANVAQTNGFYDYRDGRAQTVQWAHDKLASITGGDQAVIEARDRIINEAIKNGADPVALAAALSTPGVAEDLNGLAVIEAASIRSFGGRSFNDLTDTEKTQVLEKLGGSVTVGSANYLATGAPEEGGSVSAQTRTADEISGSIRQSAGVALTGVVTSGEKGVEKVVNWVGADNAEALGYAVAVATAGPARFGIGLALDKSGITGQIQAVKQEYLVDPTAQWIGTYGFDAQTPEQLGVVHPASNTIASVAVDTTLSMVGGAIKDTAKSIVQQSNGFSDKVQAADDAITGTKAAVDEGLGSGAGVGGGATFANQDKLDDHFARHGGDFGASSPHEYQAQADAFLTSSKPVNVLEKVRANGDIVRYNPITDEFGVVSSKGDIRTYYKPDPAAHGKGTNLDYFNAQ